MTYEKTVHTLLHIAKPITTRLPLRLARVLQDSLSSPIIKRFGAKPYYFQESGETDSFFAYPHEKEMGDTIYLYMHGGAYTAGGHPYVRGIAGALAWELQACVAGCVYRLAPEYPYPCGLDDAFGCYVELLKKRRKIALIGESAGGGMIFALCGRIRESKLPMPKAVIAFSPWLNLAMTGESTGYNKHKDPSLTVKQLKKSADSYAVNTTVNDPGVSPVFADTTGFPPTLMYVGGDEILLSDTIDMRDNLLRHGVECEVHIGDNLWHAYPLYRTRHNDEIFTRINEFVCKHD